MDLHRLSWPALSLHLHQGGKKEAQGIPGIYVTHSFNPPRGLRDLPQAMHQHKNMEEQSPAGRTCMKWDMSSARSVKFSVQAKIALVEGVTVILMFAFFFF